MPIYKRILLKLSGESLMGTQKYGLSTEVLGSYAEQIAAIAAEGVQIGIVIGGGNIFRGLTGVGRGFDRVKGDQMGMLATVINSLALQGALESAGAKAQVLTSIRMEPVGELYSKAKALEPVSYTHLFVPDRPVTGRNRKCRTIKTGRKARPATGSMDGSQTANH